MMCRTELMVLSLKYQELFPDSSDMTVLSILDERYHKTCKQNKKGQQAYENMFNVINRYHNKIALYTH